MPPFGGAIFEEQEKLNMFHKRFFDMGAEWAKPPARCGEMNVLHYFERFFLSFRKIHIFHGAGGGHFFTHKKDTLHNAGCP